MRGLTLAVCLLGLAAMTLAMPSYLDEQQQDQQQQQIGQTEQSRREMAEKIQKLRQQQPLETRRTEMIVLLRPRVLPLHHTQSHRLSRAGVVFFEPQQQQIQQQQQQQYEAEQRQQLVADRMRLERLQQRQQEQEQQRDQQQQQEQQEQQQDQQREDERREQEQRDQEERRRQQEQEQQEQREQQEREQQQQQQQQQQQDQQQDETTTTEAPSSSEENKERLRSAFETKTVTLIKGIRNLGKASVSMKGKIVELRSRLVKESEPCDEDKENGDKSAVNERKPKTLKIVNMEIKRANSVIERTINPE